MSDARLVKQGRALGRSAACAFLAWLLGACAPEQIVAASADGGAAGAAGASSAEQAGVAGQSATSCTTNDDCAAGELCEKSDCHAASGQCVSQQICDAAPAPVCGCDGITYFNDCLRQASGVQASTVGPCRGPAAMPCGAPGEQCPSDAYCGKLAPFVPMGAPCAPNIPGTCWVLPAACDPTPPGGDRWSPCGSAPACLDVCAAVRSELPHERAVRCPPP